MEQLRRVGIEKASAHDPITEQDKSRLLSYLQASHGTSEQKRITLQKRDPNTPGKPAAGSKLNPVILVGGIGRISYVQADASGKKLLESYLEQVCAIWASLRRLGDDGFDRRYREACRRMAETLKQLRKLVKRVLPPVDGDVRTVSSVQRRSGAFFHVLKVDGRNLP